MRPGDLVLLNPLAAGLPRDDPNGRVLGTVLRTAPSSVHWLDDVEVLWSDGPVCWHAASSLILANVFGFDVKTITRMRPRQ